MELALGVVEVRTSGARRGLSCVDRISQSDFRPEGDKREANREPDGYFEESVKRYQRNAGGSGREHHDRESDTRVSVSASLDLQGAGSARLEHRRPQGYVQWP